MPFVDRTGMDILGVFSWDDVLLDDIAGDRLYLKLRKGIPGADQKSECRFDETRYQVLTLNQQKEIDGIFKNNIGKSIESILNLEFIKK